MPARKCRVPWPRPIRRGTVTLCSCLTLVASPGYGRVSLEDAQLPPSVPKTFTVPLTIVAGFPLAPVFVNGQGPFAFLIDTGGHSTMLSEGLATRLRLVPRVRYAIDTVAGSAFALGGTVNHVSLGPRSWTQREVLWMPFAALHAIDARIDGVLGLDLLGELDLLLDYQRARLTILPPHEAEARLDGTRTPLVMLNGRFGVTAVVDRQRSSDSVALVLDSGATDLVLFDSAAARALRRRARPLVSEVRLDSHAGTRTAPLLELPSLTIDRVKLASVRVVDVRAPAGERLEDGLLPMRLFHRVYFAPTAGYVMLDASIKR